MADWWLGSDFELVEKAVDGLARDQRSVLLMTATSTYKQIGTILGVDSQEALDRARRARRSVVAEVRGTEDVSREAAGEIMSIVDRVVERKLWPGDIDNSEEAAAREGVRWSGWGPLAWLREARADGIARLAVGSRVARAWGVALVVLSSFGAVALVVLSLFGAAEVRAYDEGVEAGRQESANALEQVESELELSEGVRRALESAHAAQQKVLESRLVKFCQRYDVRRFKATAATDARQEREAWRSQLETLETQCQEAIRGFKLTSAIFDRQRR